MSKIKISDLNSVGGLLTHTLAGVTLVGGGRHCQSSHCFPGSGWSSDRPRISDVAQILDRGDQLVNVVCLVNFGVMIRRGSFRWMSKLRPPTAMATEL